jgi:hypothetical protein
MLSQIVSVLGNLLVSFLVRSLRYLANARLIYLLTISYLSIPFESEDYELVTIAHFV